MQKRPASSVLVSSSDLVTDSFLDGGHAVRVIHLLTIKIAHVEDINNLIHFRADFGNPDIQAGPIKGVRDLVKEPREIVCIDFDNGEKIRSFIVYNNSLRLS